jgi:DNA-binding transcriptional LysR family regulator
MTTDRLAAMEIFVRVVEAGSFSAAAAQLRVGQPAVSKVVAQLEERLGVRLLLRSTRSLSLTEAGKNFYESAKRAIENVDQAELAARSDAGLTGTLRVSASICFARLHILPRLSEFLALHPDINVEVIAEDRLINLVEDGVDLALRTGDLIDSSLTVRKIGQSQRRVMASSSYLKQRGIPREPSELLAHDSVLLQRNGLTHDHWAFVRGGVETPITLRGRVKVSSGEALREAVLSNLGFAVISDWLFTPEIASGAVQPVLTDWTLPSLNLWAVFASGKLVTAKTREFVSFVERCMAELAEGQTPALRLVGGA